MRVSDKPTPYAVLCSTDGRVFLTSEEYNRQMNRPDSRWECPKCGEKPVDFDDDNYEQKLLG